MIISVLRQAILVAICLVTMAVNLSGQSKIIELWDGKVPGAILNINFKETIDSADNWTKMRFVTNK